MAVVWSIQRFFITFKSRIEINVAKNSLLTLASLTSKDGQLSQLSVDQAGITLPIPSLANSTDLHTARILKIYRNARNVADLHWRRFEGSRLV